ncbi:MAG: hypothetical protein ACRD5K_00865 [Candidatus Acidiferrales bacterium]
MSDTRALDRAVKWLYEKDGDSPDEPPHPKKRARPRRGVPPSAFRHDRKCSVCRHAERDEIEREFLHWRSAESIAKEYGIAHHSSIYRHARATGLFAQRATTIKLALSPLIEQAAVVPVTADSVIRAVVAFAHVNDQGEWVEPPKRVVHHSSKRAAPRSEESEGLNVAPASPDEAGGSSAGAPSALTRTGVEAQQPFDASPLAVSAHDTGECAAKVNREPVSSRT